MSFSIRRNSRLVVLMSGLAPLLGAGGSPSCWRSARCSDCDKATHKGGGEFRFRIFLRAFVWHPHQRHGMLLLTMTSSYSLRRCTRRALQVSRLARAYTQRWPNIQSSHVHVLRHATRVPGSINHRHRRQQSLSLCAHLFHHIFQHLAWGHQVVLREQKQPQMSCHLGRNGARA